MKTMMTVPEEIAQRIMHLAQQEHLTPEVIMERALESFTYDLEDIRAAYQHDEQGDDEILTVEDATRMLYEMACNDQKESH